MESTAYLFATEALVNVVKHAGQCSATVVVTSTSEDLVVTVEDDGAGFAPTTKLRLLPACATGSRPWVGR